MARMSPAYDVIVVGGGPAGATTARYAAQGGLSVLIVDKKSELGAPVQCSGAVSANALRECEVPFDEEFIAEAIYGFLTYSNEGEAAGLDYRAHGRLEPLGYVVDRKRFDRCLNRLALAAGADLWLKTRALGFTRHDGLVSVRVERFGRQEEVTAKVIAGADGIMSQVGLWAGLHVAIPPGDLASCLQYIVANVETCGLLEIVTGHTHAPGGYAWVFPKGHGLAEVGLGVARTLSEHDARWHLDRFMAESFMRERFRGAQVLEVQGGGVPLGAALRQMYADNVIVVGDAARQVNPLTGGGIHTALRGGRIAGEFLAERLKSGGCYGREELKGYQARWRSEMGLALAELYRLKRQIFRGGDHARQDRALFETMRGYFAPDSKFRKV
jgi:digeranylgeranylglycerophospholipid reductase